MPRELIDVAPAVEKALLIGAPRKGTGETQLETDRRLIRQKIGP